MRLWRRNSPYLSRVQKKLSAHAPRAVSFSLLNQQFNNRLLLVKSPELPPEFTCVSLLSNVKLKESNVRISNIRLTHGIMDLLTGSTDVVNEATGSGDVEIHIPNSGSGESRRDRVELEESGNESSAESGSGESGDQEYSGESGSGGSGEEEDH